MRAGTYYVIAAALVLATVPMYRYIFQRAGELDHPPSVRTVYVSPAAQAYSRTVDAAVPPPMAMLPGESCIGGVVIYVTGHSYTNAVDGDGRAIRCEGRQIIR